MNALISTVNPVTMTSLELVDYINSQRGEGESELRHDHFMAKVQKVLGEGGVPKFRDTYTNPQNGQQYAIYRFLKREACLMAMSYSYDLQAKVFDRMTALESAATPTIPNFANPADAARAWAAEYEARLLAENTKAQIGARREATAMNTASQAVKKVHQLEVQLDKSKQYATVKRMEMLHHGQPFNWRLLKSAAAEMGIPAIDVFDANYGTVKAYHADVWREVYAVSADVGATP